MEELLKLLPPPALLGLGAVIGLGLLVRHFGFWQGQNMSPAKGQAAAEVAAVVVDPSALNRATAALEAQTMEAVHFRKSLERACEKVCQSLDRLCEEVNDLNKELIRKGH